ncbi:NACHT domain-containing protein [Kitasatospora sp. NPDC057936]|uniref:NACHT domain-containing protein n=1 Tax=Kitasatospora sp. NPDC057936 TaxID=3346283 RepID=UPI0036DA6649
MHNAAKFYPLATVQLLATALGRDPGEVTPLWKRAKLALDRATAAQRAADAPRLASWDRLPAAGAVLGNLLGAQAAVVDRLPYDLLDVVEPPLSAIYVRQHVRAQTVREPADGGPEARGGPAAQERSGTKSPEWDAVLPASDLLDRHTHLLVTGEPGAGKSTLAHHLTWLLARIWLREESIDAAPTAEPLVPLRIAARDLVGEEGSWSAALCGAALACMGHSLLVDPEPGLFAGRVHGARWLVMVDGLDEVTDRQERAGIIRAVAQHARADSAYRFLVTSRPLPETELAPLRAAGFEGYRMEPFDEAELRTFAHQWFTAQGENAEAAAASVARFLEEIADGRLSELVRNPLLATIAAISATLEPLRALPSNRLSLYRRFLEYLLRRREGGAPWLEDLLETLGRYRIEQGGLLTAAAREWLKGRADPSDRELRAVLLDSGLLVAHGDDLRFLHQSFAEFLAARSYAAEIPPDFPDLKAWVARATGGAGKTLALFTFRLWSEREGCDGDLIVGHLLGEVEIESLTLAASLIAEGVTIGPGLRMALADRLMDCARNDSSETVEAMRGLAAFGDDPMVVERLRAVATGTALGLFYRLEAVGALTRSLPVIELEELLRSVLPDTYGLLPRAARIARTISSGAQKAVIQHAHAWEGRWDHLWATAVKAQTLETLGIASEAAGYARDVLSTPVADASDRRMAAEAWLSADPGAAGEIAELALRYPGARGGGAISVALALEKLGEGSAAARIAQGLLDSDLLDGEQLQQAAELWAKAPGHEGADLLLQAFERMEPEGDGSGLLPSAAKLGASSVALDWARTHAAGAQQRNASASRIIAVLLAALGPAGMAEITDRFGGGERIDPFDLVPCAEELLNGGVQRAAREFAERALRTPRLGPELSGRAVDVLYEVSAVDALAVLEREAKGLAGRDPGWRAGVLHVLALKEGDRHHGLMVELAHCQLQSPEVDGQELLDALRILVLVEGRKHVDRLVDTVITDPRVTLGQMVDLASDLVSIGEREAAVRLWWRLLEDLVPPRVLEWHLLRDVQRADLVPEAVAKMTELIDAESTAPAKRLRLRQMRAWLREAAEPGA